MVLRRRFTLALAASALAFSLPSIAQQKMVIKAADVQPVGYPTVVALERMGKKLVLRNKERQHEAALNRIRAQMALVCAKLPAADPARSTCNAVLKTASVSKA